MYHRDNCMVLWMQVTLSIGHLSIPMGASHDFPKIFLKISWGYYKWVYPLLLAVFIQMQAFSMVAIAAILGLVLPSVEVILG